MPTPAELAEATLKALCPELIAQQAKRRAEKLRARDYEGYLFLHDGHKRLPAFLEIERVLPDKDFWKCLALTWDNIEVSAPGPKH
ncbi:MAG TPA: hypothetical protein VFU08_02730 [Candidatus Udaeobacter sp.]|jgi:hypothetical protein|nr:hypothetical protein [Candidatus Udaeobacter sp.]